MNFKSKKNTERHCAMNNTLLITLGLLLATATVLPQGVKASELVYTPVNPSFGGSPLNGNFLLSNAQSQNDHKDPDAVDEDQTPLEEFNDRLQRALLSRLSSTLSSSFVDDNGELIPGTTETSDFIIDIADQGNGTLSITTTDKVTGDSTSFTVDSVI